MSTDRWYGQEGQWFNPGYGGGKTNPKGNDKGGKDSGKGYDQYYKGAMSKGGGKGFGWQFNKGYDKGKGKGKGFEYGKGGKEYANNFYTNNYDMIEADKPAPLGALLDTDFVMVPPKNLKNRVPKEVSKPPGLTIETSNRWKLLAQEDEKEKDPETTEFVLPERWAPLQEATSPLRATKGKMPKVRRWKRMHVEQNSLGTKQNHKCCCVHDKVPTFDPDVLKNPEAFQTII